MVSSSACVVSAQRNLFTEPRVRLKRLVDPPRRTEPYDIVPGYYEAGGIWLYGNVRLLRVNLAYVPDAFGPERHCAQQLASIEAAAERIVFEHGILVCGIHNEAHRRASVVPLRWGAPRIVVFSGGFQFHLGELLRDEPFRAARLWRYQWDPQTDLAISRRAPDKLPTFASHNRTVDLMIERIAGGAWPGLMAHGNPLENLLAASP